MGRTLDEGTIRVWDALLANSAEVVALLGADLTIVYVTPQVEPLSGFTREELLGRLVNDFVASDDLEKIASTQRRLITMPGVSGEAHFRFRRKDGTYQWVEARATNRLDDPEFRGILIRWNAVAETKADAEVFEGSNETARLLREHRQLVAAIADAESPEHLAELVVHGIRRERGADAAGLYVIDAKSGDLVLLGSSGLSDAFLQGAARYPAASPRLAWFARSRRTTAPRSSSPRRTSRGRARAPRASPRCRSSRCGIEASSWVASTWRRSRSPPCRWS